MKKVLTIIMILFLSGCSSQANSNLINGDLVEMQEIVEDLESRLEDLEYENDLLQSENEELRYQLDEVSSVLEENDSRLSDVELILQMDY